MTTFAVPTSINKEDAHYRQSTILGGREFLLEFYWNQRDKYWYLSVFDQDERPIATCMRVVLGTPLLRGVYDQGRPLGVLVAMDLTQSSTPPNINELGSRVALLFNDEALPVGFTPETS